MNVKDTPNGFGIVSLLNHWLSAVLIIAMIGLGWYMAELPRGPDRSALFALHKSLGVLVLTLAVLRLGWRISNPFPRLLGEPKPWEAQAARMVHWLLIAAMLTMTLSGWLLSSAAGRPVEFFGLFALPNPIGENETLEELFEGVHGLTANLLVLLIAVHVVAALKHHFVARDGTLRRMLGRGRG